MHPDTITLDTQVHLCWATDLVDELEQWHEVIGRAGARVVQFRRLQDPRGYALTVETTVRAALVDFGYSPERLAAIGFEGTTGQVRRLQALHWAILLPPVHPEPIAPN
jgi:hypothetical protein